MFSRLLLLILVSLSYSQLSAQCGITLDAGTNINVCEPGAQVQLNGSTSDPTITTVSWTPAAGLSDPSSLAPTVFVSSTTTFTLNALVADPSNNLLVNSGFEAGLTGFTSDYIQGTGGPFGLLSSEGQFAVASNGNLVHNNFPSCVPPSGSGQMLIVNGATIPGESIWCQTVNVTPGTEYQISAFFSSAVSDNPANLLFNINGVDLGSIFSLSSAVCNWQNFAEVWNSGGATTADICILNQNTQGGGNDFNIDDIFFSPVCQTSDQVTVTVVPVLAFVLPPDNLSCANGSSVFLDGSFSLSGPNYTFQWVTSDGNIVSGANTPIAEVDQPGSYTLRVTFDDGTVSCPDEVTVVVTGDVPPTAVANAPDILGCTITDVNINGNGSSTGGSITYQWTTTDGNILSGDNTISPSVNQPGTYELLVTNTITGCTDVSTVMVTEDLTPPVSNPLAPDQLDCLNSSVELLGVASTMGPNITYSWTTADGNIVSGQNSINSFVDQEGTYDLLVTNTLTGCTATASVLVSQNLAQPTADGFAGPALDCFNNTSEVSATGSSMGPNIEYEWTTADGSIISGGNTFTASVGAPGTYDLLVTNTSNSCTATFQVVMTGDFNEPATNVIQPGPITCANGVQLLDGSGSSTGSNITYQWTTINGNIISGADSIIADINSPGTYELQVTNTNNSCVSNQEIVVGIDTAPPTANAGMSFLIDCGGGQGQLDGSNSSTAGNFSYLWTTIDGGIVSGEDSLSPVINIGGTYELLVTNLDNGCTATDMVTITQNGNIPAVQVVTPDTLNCTTNSLQLDATGSSSGANFNFNWSTIDGVFDSGTDSFQPTVSAPGTYVLNILDTDNNCENSFAVTVAIDTLAPTVSAGLDSILTCAQTTIQLDPTGSDLGAGFNLDWSTTDGEPTTGSTPTISTPGTYQLLVTDLSNNCPSTDQVTIGIDTISPVADPGLSQELNCQDSSFIIGGPGTSAGVNFSYVWTSAGGSFLSPTDGPEATIDGPGSYQLLVVDSNNGCDQTATVVITEDVTIPNLDAGLPFELDCNNPTFELGVTADQGSEFSYLWTTTDGNLITAPGLLAAEVDAAGTYFLQITNSDNFCSNIDSVSITQDTMPPTAEAGNGFILDCNQLMVELDGSNSSTGPNFDYLWTTADGSFVGSTTDEMVEVDAPGLYQILVTNTANGCTATDTVSVLADSQVPIADPGVTQTLNCQDGSFVIGGPNTSIGAVFTYVWTTADGNFISPTNAATTMIDAPGTYQLLVTNSNNSCNTTATVIITEDITPPTLNAGPSLELTCRDTEFELEESADQGTEFSYLWTTPDGNLLTAPALLAAEVDAPGTYFLQVTNNDNFCVATDSVLITQDIIPPVADAGNTFTLDCNQSTVSLDGSNSSGGPGFEYLWSTANGNFLSGVTTNMPTINAAGTYSLTVTNTVNGCVANNMVTINVDSLIPSADAGLNQTLNCLDTFFIIGGTGTSAGPEFTFSWTTTGGNFLSNTDAAQATINGSGSYELLVTDTDNGCTQTASVTITQDIVLPIVDAGPSMELNCDITELALAPIADDDLEFLPQWTTSDGNLLTIPENLAAEVDLPGTYYLLVTNSINFCSALDSVVVTQDTMSPIADAGSAFTLDCGTSEIDLDGGNSSSGPGFSYQWSTTNGNILSGADGLSPRIDADGGYQLLVSNNDNGCTAISNVIISRDILQPIVTATAPEVLNCILSSTDLNATGSDFGTGFTLNWSTFDGSFESGTDGLTPRVNAPGTYVLTIQNDANNCEEELSIIVSQNIVPPMVDAGDGLVQNCTGSTVNLSGSATGGGPFTYSWMSSTGQILSDGDSPRPLVDGPGVYTLTVIDQSNGCSATDQMTLTQNLLLDFEFELDDPTCQLPTGTVIFAGIDGGTAPFLYSVDSGENFQTTPLFGGLQPGSYELLIQDFNGCQLTENIGINTFEPLTVSLPDVIELELGDDFTIYPQLNIPADEIMNLQWSPADGLSCNDCLTPVATPTESRRYQLEVNSIDGCNASALISFLVNRERPIYFPTGFSPDGDGVNDLFFPFARRSAVQQINSFQIYNRWGENVFEDYNFQPSDPAHGWDGKHRGETLNPAVFVYFAEVEFIDGVTEVIKGEVILVR